MTTTREGNFGAIPQPAERRRIDGDAIYVPEGWSVVEHRKYDQIEFDPKRVAFHLDPAQKAGRIAGNDLRKKLANEPVLNANVLDHLLANTNLIPEDWKFDEQGRERCIFFWGTIYRDSAGNLYVRYLYWYDGQWRERYRWIDLGFDDQLPAALSAS